MNVYIFILFAISGDMCKGFPPFAVEPVAIRVSRGQAVTPQIDLPGPEVPCFLLESKPGDIFFLNMDLWHASFGGKLGRQHLALTFTPEPTLPEHLALLKKDYQGVLNSMEQIYTNMLV